MAVNCAYECGSQNPECGLTTTDPTCDACFQTACLQECVEATAEPALGDYLNCIQSCYDDQCMSECEAQYPEANLAFNKPDGVHQHQLLE